MTALPFPLEWTISQGLTEYPAAMEQMERRVAALIAHEAGEQVWLLEHPALYTSGTSAKDADLLATPFPVFAAGRGGQYTYHGPGQRVGYVMLDLKARGRMDVRRYVQDLEQWVIATLAQFGLKGEVTDRAGNEAKIAALGIRIRKWVTFHGISLNVAPDLSHYRGIVPCGLPQFGVTSLAALGITASMAEVDAALQSEFAKRF
jgi:lipoyl(octanoyl) transferase